MPIPPADDYITPLAHALAAIANGDRQAADSAVTELRTELPARYRRRSISPSVQARVLRRDRFYCRYCAGRTIPLPVLRAATLLWPDVIPYEATWRIDNTHPMITAHVATIDHVWPIAQGGTSEFENLATSCWTCNAQKSEYTLERLGWDPLPQPPLEDWDGLVSFYPAAWDAVQHKATPTEAKFHTDWLKAFERAART